MQITIDLNSLTLGDVEDLEEYCGVPIMELEGRLRSNRLSTRMLTGLVWIMRRKTEPEFTIAQARELKFTEFDVAYPKAGADAAEASAGASDGSAPSATTTPQ